jgi:hypothetical protein
MVVIFNVSSMNDKELTSIGFSQSRGFPSRRNNISVFFIFLVSFSRLNLHLQFFFSSGTISKKKSSFIGMTSAAFSF